MTRNFKKAYLGVEKLSTATLRLQPLVLRNLPKENIQGLSKSLSVRYKNDDKANNDSKQTSNEFRTEN